MNKKLIVKNLFYLFFGHALSAVLFFVAMAHLARVLGPDYFGIISFAEVIFMFFLTLSNVGLAFLGTRDIARNSDKVEYFTDRLLSIRLILGLVGLLVLVVMILILKKPILTKTVVFIYGIALIPASLLIDWVFQGLEKMVFVALAVFVRALTFMLGVFLLVKNNDNLFLAALIFLLSWIFSAGSLLIAYKRQYGFPKFNWSQDFTKKAIRDAWPIGLTLIVGWIVHYFDGTILFLWKGEAAAGQYNAAYRPIILMATALTVYYNAIFPTMVKAAASAESSLKKLVDVSMKVGFLVFLPLAILGTFLAKPLMILVYGTAFEESSAMFKILVWWPILILLIMNYSRIVLCYDKQHDVGKFSIITALANILFNVSLIPFLSGVGAALAKVFADIVTFLIYFKYTKLYFSFSIKDSLKYAIIPTFAMMAFLIFFPNLSVSKCAGVGLLIYTAVFLIVYKMISGKRVRDIVKNFL